MSQEYRGPGYYKPKYGPRARAAMKALREEHEQERANRPPPAPIPKYVPKPVGGTHVFFHPDLGIGGAERLVVDAAVGLKNKGANVVIYTNHCDPNHCFDECRDGEHSLQLPEASPQYY